MKRNRYADISMEEEEEEEEERRRTNKKKAKRKRYADIPIEKEEESRRRCRKKKLRRKRYADIPIEEEEEEEGRRTSRKKMKVEGKRKRCYVDIPMDVLVDVLSRLPAKCVWRLRSVCKDWKSHIESPYFANLQLRQSKEERVFMFWSDGYGRKHGYRRTRFYSIDYKYGKAVQVVQEFLHPADTKPSSINGLVCYYGIDGVIKVCNPVTRQQINLPKPSFLLSSKRSKTSRLDIGIGFDSTSKTYKVLAFYDGRNHPKVEIFTLGGTKGWRKLQLPSPTTYFCPREGVYSNGCAFWLTAEYVKSLGGGADGDMLRALMTFNFAQEKFEFVPLPPDIDIYHSHHLIREVGGRGCLIEAKMKRKRVKLWTLAPNSPTKLWADHHAILPHPQHYICNLGLFPISSGVMQFDFFKRTKHIFFYNQQGHVVKSINVHDIPPRYSPLQLHTESLVSL